MTERSNPPSDEAVGAALRGLAADAPATLRPATLLAIGLADAWAPLDSPIGRLFVAFNGRGVSRVALATDDASFESAFAGAFGRPIRRADRLPERLGRALERRLAGDRRARVPVDLRGATPFQRAVWEKALEIPRGEVRPYGWVAAEIGRPGAVRAVGSALGHNPVPLVVPCHRVVRSDGRIGDYALGSERKRAVLQAEGLDLERLEGLARAGVHFLGSDTTRIFCLPTCGQARRIQPAHEVRFRSRLEARAAGYRPCRRCRPGEEPDRISSGLGPLG